MDVEIMKRLSKVKEIKNLYEEVKENLTNLKEKCFVAEQGLDCCHQKEKLNCYDTCQAGYRGIIIECDSLEKSIDKCVYNLSNYQVSKNGERKFRKNLDFYLKYTETLKQDHERLNGLYERLKNYEEKDRGRANGEKE